MAQLKGIAALTSLARAALAIDEGVELYSALVDLVRRHQLAAVEAAFFFPREADAELEHLQLVRQTRMMSVMRGLSYDILHCLAQHTVCQKLSTHGYSSINVLVIAPQVRTRMTLLTEMLVAGNLGTACCSLFCAAGTPPPCFLGQCSSSFSGASRHAIGSSKSCSLRHHASACRSASGAGATLRSVNIGPVQVFVVSLPEGASDVSVAQRSLSSRGIHTYQLVIADTGLQRFRLGFQNFLLTHAPGAMVHVITFSPQLLISKILKFGYLWRRKSLRYLLDSVDFYSFIDGPTNSVIGMAMVNDRGVASHNLLDGYVCNSTRNPAIDLRGNVVDPDHALGFLTGAASTMGSGHTASEAFFIHGTISGIHTEVIEDCCRACWCILIFHDTVHCAFDPRGVYKDTWWIVHLTA